MFFLSRAHPSIHPSIRPSIHPSIHPSVRPSIHPSIALQDFDQALALKQQEARVGERLQKAKIRCQATEATKPIDLEEVHL